MDQRQARRAADGTDDPDRTAAPYPWSRLHPLGAAPGGRGAGSDLSTGDTLRIGDAERERAVTEIGEHFAAGRLTPDELDDRLGQAWAARTAADLRPLFADLPRGGVALRPDEAPVRPAGRGLRAGPPFGMRRIGSPFGGFPLPLLLVLAVVLTIVTHVPFVVFFLWWFVMGRFFGRGRRPAHVYRS